MNQEPFKIKNDVIPLSRIDTDDHTCLLALFVQPDTVVQSIRDVGLISPPLVTEKKGGGCAVVCGFRRIKACEILEWRKVPVRILERGYSPYDLLRLAIWDNRCHRDLNVVEQARGIEKLKPYMPKKGRLEILSVLLGFPCNEKVFNKICNVGRAPEPVQLGVLKGEISFEAAVDLCKFPSEDALALFSVLTRLKLSQNKQKEFIALVGEIAIIEDLDIAATLQSLGVEDILGRPDLNRNEKAAAIKNTVKRRRFPTLVKAEEMFSKHLKALKLHESIKISPPPYFEGGAYRLRMRFASFKDLEACQRRLDALKQDPAMKRLLEPYDEP